jgi:predicted TPR repeat methyltransferase
MLSNINVENQNSMASIDIAFSHHSQGDLSSAEKIYLELINANNDLTAMNAYSALLSQLQRYEEAHEILGKAIDISKNTHENLLPALLNSRGNLYRRQNNSLAAIKDYKTCLALSATYFPAINNLATAYLQADNISKAETYYNQAISIQPNNSSLQVNLAICYIKKNNLDAARDALTAALTIAPNDFTATRQLAEIELNAQNFQAAKDLFYQYSENNPFDIDAITALAQCMIETGECKAAINALENILEENPKNLDANYLIATAYVKLGDMQKALASYHKQIEVNPNLESYYNVGVILMNMNRFTESIHYFIESLAYNPDNIDAHMNLASIYLKRQEYEKARNHYYKAQSIDPKNKEIPHILSAITQDEVAQRAPDEYVQNLFDQYSDNYDQHLDYLKFQVPDLINNSIQNLISPSEGQLSMLDLGCGTGLSAQKLQDYCHTINGVDLSEKMLEIAKNKNIYDNLRAEDISQYLKNDNSQYDVIIAGDVLPYIGNLSELFKLVRQKLNKAGLFVFTIEADNSASEFSLQKSVRYAHSKKYIETLADKYNYQVSAIENANLRNNMKQPIPGYCIALQAK